MTIINYETEASKLFNKIKSDLKKVKGCYVSNILCSNIDKNTYWIQVDTCSPSYVCDVIEDTITKSKYGSVVHKEAHEGSFDWASDTYIKDCSVVTFTMK